MMRLKSANKICVIEKKAVFLHAFLREQYEYYQNTY